MTESGDVYAHLEVTMTAKLVEGTLVTKGYFKKGYKASVGGKVADKTYAFGVRWSIDDSPSVCNQRKARGLPLRRRLAKPTATTVLVPRARPVKLGEPILVSCVPIPAGPSPAPFAARLMAFEPFVELMDDNKANGEEDGETGGIPYYLLPADQQKKARKQRKKRLKAERKERRRMARMHAAGPASAGTGGVVVSGGVVVAAHSEGEGSGSDASSGSEANHGHGDGDDDGFEGSSLLAATTMVEKDMKQRRLKGPIKEPFGPATVHPVQWSKHERVHKFTMHACATLDPESGDGETVVLVECAVTMQRASDAAIAVALGKEPPDDDSDRESSDNELDNDRDADDSKELFADQEEDNDDEEVAPSTARRKVVHVCEAPAVRPVPTVADLYRQYNPVAGPQLADVSHSRRRLRRGLGPSQPLPEPSPATARTPASPAEVIELDSELDASPLAKRTLFYPTDSVPRPGSHLHDESISTASFHSTRRRGRVMDSDSDDPTPRDQPSLFHRDGTVGHSCGSDIASSMEEPSREPDRRQVQSITRSSPPSGGAVVPPPHGLGRSSTSLPNDGNDAMRPSDEHTTSKHTKKLATASGRTRTALGADAVEDDNPDKYHTGVLVWDSSRTKKAASKGALIGGAIGLGVSILTFAIVPILVVSALGAAAGGASAPVALSATRNAKMRVYSCCGLPEGSKVCGNSTEASS